MDAFTSEFIGRLLIYMVVLLLAISAHEAAHAWMSWKYGDDTAFLLGRVTLNPVSHTDPIGTLALPILGFVFGAIGGFFGSIPLIGWGKPTPVNPRKWTNYKTANVMVSIAGILANLLIATIGFTIAKSLIIAGVFQNESFSDGIGTPIAIFLETLIYLNVSLAVFNLLPIPPLDGSKVLSTFLPTSFQPVLDVLDQYGYVILLLLLYNGVFSIIIAPVYGLVDFLLKL